MIFGLRNNTKSIALENMTPQQWGKWFNGDMLAVELAYAEVPWFGAALDHRKNAFSNMPFDLLKIGSDNVVADESNYEEELNDSPELNIFRKLPNLITDLDLYGCAYMIYEVNEYGLNGAWRRLHPSSIRPEYNTVTGELLYFTRTLGGLMFKIELDDPNFFYLWMPERAHENRHGEGVGKRALRAATTINNTDIFQATFFKNGAINPTILQIKGYATQDKEEKERTQNVLSRMMSGIANAFKIVPLDAEVKVMTLMQNLRDMAMQEMTNQQRENISTATGVPHSLLFSNAANFATAQQDDFNFYDKTIAPLASNVVEEQANERFFVPRGLRLKYRKERLEVYQKLELDSVDKLMPLFNAAIIDENEVRTNIGFGERPDGFEVPVRLLTPQTKDDEADTQEQESQTQGGKGSAENIQVANKKSTNDSLAAYAYIPLANNPDIIRLIQRLKNRFNDERIEWQAAPTYHVTLCYAQLISNDVIDQMAKLLRPFEVELHGAYLDVFETPEGKALHIRLDDTQALSDLQAHVYNVFSMLPNGGLSEFSKPESYKPHITLAYLPNDIEWEVGPVSFRALVDCVIVGRGDYEPALIVEAPKRIVTDNYPDEYLQVKTDFQKWERLAVKRWQEGKREKASSFTSEFIPSITQAAVVGALDAAQTVDDVKAIFAEAVFTAPLWSIYG